MIKLLFLSDFHLQLRGDNAKRTISKNIKIELYIIADSKNRAESNNVVGFGQNVLFPVYI